MAPLRTRFGVLLLIAVLSAVGGTRLALGASAPASAEVVKAPGLRTLTIPLAASRISLDPRRVLDQSSLWVGRQLNCQLVHHRGSEVVNDAAEQIRFLSPKLIEIRLKKGLRFSDGTAVTAQDVHATFDFLQRSRRVHRNLLHWIAEVTVKSELTLTVRLNNPVPRFLRTLAAPTQAIFPKSFLQRAEKDERAWESPVGCGAYRISARSRTPSKSGGANTNSAPREVIELSPIRSPLPSLRFVLTGSGTITKSEAAEYDLIGLTIASDVSHDGGKVVQGGPTPPSLGEAFDVVELMDPYQVYFALNTRVPPWDKRENRCALLERLSVSAPVKAYGGVAEPATDWFPRGVLGYQQDPKARLRSGSSVAGENTQIQAIKKAASPADFCLTYLAVSIPEAVRPAYAEMLTPVFPSLKTQVLADPRQFGLAFDKLRCDSILFGLKSGYLDGYEYIQLFAESDANVTRWSDPELIAAIRSSQDIADAVQRLNAYRSIVHRLNEECVTLPVVTIPRRRIHLKKDLDFVDIGKQALDAYFLGSVRPRR